VVSSGVDLTSADNWKAAKERVQLSEQQTLCGVL
jgi:hypothetical protein